VQENDRRQFAVARGVIEVKTAGWGFGEAACDAAYAE
jgi:hypothetical protein